MNIETQKNTPKACDAIRYQNDSALSKRLLKHPDVIRVNKWLENEADKGHIGIRRRLLATSVRLNKSTAADVHRLADECIETLEIDIPHELYVYASPTVNAACFKPEDGKLFIMFSSSLLERFSGNELKFVIGHEFGHYVYGHHAIPIGHILNGKQKPDPRLVLDLFTWSRNAEVSADRAGAYCANNLHAVARSLFKLASGLNDHVINFELDEFLQQVEEMQHVDAEPDNNAPQEDWFSTHPFSPLRVKAIQSFYHSEFMCDNGFSHAELEAKVHQTMSLMEPSYLEGRTESAIIMSRLLYASLIAIANADNVIDEQEIEIFEQFFGKGEFNKNLNIDRIIEALPDRIAASLKANSISQRMQVMRDICIMYHASGTHNNSAQELLRSIAKRLNVPQAFIDQTLAQNLEPD